MILSININLISNNIFIYFNNKLFNGQDAIFAKADF
ncbi:hypothetical protein BH23THE1_BH23THE1_00730 [soil metagenome]